MYEEGKNLIPGVIGHKVVKVEPAERNRTKRKTYMGSKTSFVENVVERAFIKNKINSEG